LVTVPDRGLPDPRAARALGGNRKWHVVDELQLEARDADLYARSARGALAVRTHGRLGRLAGLPVRASGAGRAVWRQRLERALIDARDDAEGRRQPDDLQLPAFGRRHAVAKVRDGKRVQAARVARVLESFVEHDDLRGERRVVGAAGGREVL